MKLLVGCVLALSICAPALAQTTVSVGVLAGVSVPVGSLAASGSGGLGVSSGWHLGGVVSFDHAKSPASLRIEGIYDRLGITEVPACVVQLSFSDSCFVNRPVVWSGTADLVLRLRADGHARVRPYLIGGGGLNHLALTQTDTTYGSSDTQHTKPLQTSDRTVESYTKLGVNLGAGVRVPAGRSDVSIEARWHTIFDGHQISANSSRFFLISAILGIKAHR